MGQRQGRIARLAVLVLGWGSTWAALSAGVLLVTEEEAEREARYAASAESRFEPRAVPVPGAPVIEIRSPSASSSLKSPFAIRVGFRANDGAETVPGTFKVFYGRLKLDITDRVLQKVRVGKDGVAIEEADIPAGSHRLLLQIRDSRGRTGEIPLTLTVAP